jgi:conjugative transfer signal peptidase TraF
MTMIGLFARIRATSRSRVRKLGITVAALVIGTFLAFGFFGIRFNSSPSLPVGLYIITSDEHANLVEFCPDEPFASFSIARGYRDQGVCADGAAPLLKPVVAGAGDLVDLSNDGISVNGRLLPNTVPLLKDSSGRELQPWHFGHYAVTRGTIWAASSYHPRSFDSRYFGPVPTSAIRHRLKPLLTL